jgi:hypothetical protein
LQKSRVLAPVCAFFLAVGCSLPASAQDDADVQHRRIAVGLKMSSLGSGIEFATRITRNSNLRAAFNAFAFNHTFTKDQVSYAGHLSLRSLQANYDWFPFHGSFHLSPGLLLFNGNRLQANASMTVSMADGNFSAPMTGTSRIEFYKVAPMLLVGWGNMVPHNRRHLSFPFELGVVYHGSPRASLRMGGIICDANGLNCLDTSTDPDVRSDIQEEQNKLNRAVAPFKFYPVISVGVAYSF